MRGVRGVRGVRGDEVCEAPPAGRRRLGTFICRILFTFVMMTAQTHIPAPQAAPAGAMDAGLHLSEKSYLCSAMTHGAHMPLSQLRGRTYLELLLQTMPTGEAAIADLYAWAYVQTLKELVPFAPHARTLSEAVGEVDGDTLTRALEEGWRWVKEYLSIHQRRLELEEEGVAEAAYDAILRLWSE